MAIPTVGCALFAVWRQFKDIREDSQERRNATCAENSAILEEVDSLRKVVQLLVEEVQFATQGAREVENENRALHNDVVAKGAEIVRLKRRIAAIASKKPEVCDCPKCDP